MKFSAEEKLKAIRRELNYRKHVYPRRVAEGGMTQNLADEQIEIFTEIAADYECEAGKDRLL